MSTVKMVVFDMAGTTVNENNVVYKTLHNAINEAGFPVSLQEVLAEGAGKEKLQAVSKTTIFTVLISKCFTYEKYSY